MNHQNRKFSKSLFFIITSFLFASMFSLTGCLSSLQSSRVETADNTDEHDKSVNPSVGTEQIALDIYALGDDDWSASYNPQLPQINNHMLTNRPEKISEPAEMDTIPDSLKVITYNLVQGYRVQLINVIDESRANLICELAKTHFDSVYIIYQRPNYKVRAGDFLNRQMADAAVDTAKAHGFEDAWVVPSRVYDFNSKSYQE